MEKFVIDDKLNELIRLGLMQLSTDIESNINIEKFKQNIKVILYPSIDYKSIYVIIKRYYDYFPLIDVEVQLQDFSQFSFKGYIDELQGKDTKPN